jgi:hypothetical protein
MAHVSIRHAEPDDYEALHRIFSGPRVIEGTMQLPLPSAEMWRKRLSEKPEGMYALVACADGRWSGTCAWRPIPPAGAGGTSARSGWPFATTGRAEASGRR